jgi:hypothetical protein
MTAATGDLSDIHDVMSVRLYELDLPDDVSIDVLITSTHCISFLFVQLFGIFGCLTFIMFYEQPKEEEDRSQISPSAAFFESPRGMVIYIVFIAIINDDVTKLYFNV